MKRMLLAFQFLTIIPVKDTGEVPEQRIGSSTALFPVVGFFEGALMAVFAGLFLKVFPTELTNGLLILLMIIINGGLHLDGLADTFDAIASRGDKEKKLAIMKESAVGPIGVISIYINACNFTLGNGTGGLLLQAGKTGRSGQDIYSVHGIKGIIDCDSFNNSGFFFSLFFFFTSGTFPVSFNICFAGALCFQFHSCMVFQ
jgi:hypothetical protein